VAPRASRCVFDIREQHVLLRAIETVDLVDEQQRLAAPRGQPVARFLEYRAHSLDAVRYGAQLPELTTALAGQQAGQRRLAGPWRTEKKSRPESVGLEQAAQQLALAQKMLLPTNSSSVRGRIRAAKG